MRKITSIIILLLFWAAGFISAKFEFYDEDTVINGIKFKKGWIYTYVSGVLGSGYLAADTKLFGIQCQGGKRISFYESGSLQSAILAGGTVNGIAFKPGTFVYFNEN